MTVKVGKPIFLDVNVKGEPAPDVKWFFQGQEIQSNDDYKVENVPYNTQFTVMKGSRAKSGKYKIVATNIHGEDFEWVELNFIGPPSAPLGNFYTVFKLFFDFT